MKLRDCNCGGKAKMYFGIDGDELRFVYCTKCRMQTQTYWNGNFAARDWNLSMRVNSFKKIKE